jgi:hypothetical protein
MCRNKMKRNHTHDLSFIEEYISVFFVLTVCCNRSFDTISLNHNTYLARPIIEEYFLAFLHVEKWVGDPIFD